MTFSKRMNYTWNPALQNEVQAENRTVQKRQQNRREHSMEKIIIEVSHPDIKDWNGAKEIKVHTSPESGQVSISGFFGCSVDYPTLDAALSDIGRRHGFIFTKTAI